ncbi:MAG: hypothetical protein NNA23_06200 [Nitrospira sp.]|nr:hypothetical protein [Nitrospira sp.]
MPLRTRTVSRALITIVSLLALWSSALIPTAHAVVIFSDNFEYDVGRNITNADTLFQSHGWTAVKANNSSLRRGSGYIYTLFDASRNSRVLVLESLPTTAPPPEPGFPYQQTDYWIAFGGEGSPLTTLPANVWFQFWLYTTPASQFHTAKFIYPCRGTYPCGGDSYTWLWTWQNGCGPEGNYREALTGEWFWLTRANYANNQAVPEWDRDKLYQNRGCLPFRRGQWYQIRVHVDFSSAQGVYELWARTSPTGSWTKHAEWIGGVTPQFQWPIPADQRTGNRGFRMPTTVNAVDSTIYLDDFIIATSVADLEGGAGSGAGGDTTPPIPPRDVRIAP